ncbi:MAG TPA: LysR family transcriptional regulator [Rubrivivax sp.]|nr:LysR family transcriptional regulator [Rubrivivax sp.]
MIDTIARSGSFAAAARELGKVPSALTYSVRQLEEALDVLLFDRRSRQAKFTAAGQELLNEGRRLLAESAAVANRVRRVASGWETQLSVAVDDVISRKTLFELCEAFYALDPQGKAGSGTPGNGGPGTRLRLRTEVLAGTWEALVSGQADLAIGVGLHSPPPGVAVEPLGELAFVFAVSPQHPLAGASEPIDDVELLRYRAVAVADSAHHMSPLTVNLLPGQDVLTVSSMAAKVEALVRGLGCGFIPEPMVRDALRAGTLRVKPTLRGGAAAQMGYAWRCGSGRKDRAALGLALQWWLKQLAVPTTRIALLERHGSGTA